MRFRVYDNENKCWSKQEFCLSNRGDLFMIKRSKFGKDKLELVSDKRYTVHNCTETCDVNGKLIFEGDIIRNTIAPDIVGVVGYSNEHASYYVFEEKLLSYYGLIKANREEMEIVGNVFDNQELLK